MADIQGRRVELNQELADKDREIQDKNATISNLEVKIRMLNEVVNTHASVFPKFKNLIDICWTHLDAIGKNVEGYELIGTIAHMLANDDNSIRKIDEQNFKRIFHKIMNIIRIPA